MELAGSEVVRTLMKPLRRKVVPPEFSVSCMLTGLTAYGVMGAVRVTPVGTTSIIFWSTVWQVLRKAVGSTIALMVAFPSLLKTLKSEFRPAAAPGPEKVPRGLVVVPATYSVATLLSNVARLVSNGSCPTEAGTI